MIGVGAGVLSSHQQCHWFPPTLQCPSCSRAAFCSPLCTRRPTKASPCALTGRSQYQFPPSSSTLNTHPSREAGSSSYYYSVPKLVE